MCIRDSSGGYDGAAYKGATDSYIKLPLAGLYSSNGISFTFWYKVNTSPDRSGIITINDDADNSNDNRTGGLRLFREGSTSSQTIKLNVGLGAGGESWNDGGNIAANGNWVHIGVTVSPTESKIYFNGVLQRTATYTTPFSFSSSTDAVSYTHLDVYKRQEWGIRYFDMVRLGNTSALSYDGRTFTMEKAYLPFPSAQVDKSKPLQEYIKSH